MAVLLGVVVTSAIPRGPALAQSFDHLKCYRVRDAATHGRYTAAIDTRDPADFPVEAGCVVRVPASLFCTTARQVVISPPPPGTPAGQPSQDYLCYKLKCARNKSALSLMDQFGSHQLQVGLSNLYCTPACSACNGTCADLQNDPANCGTCGNACAVGVACTGGNCGGVAPTTTSSTSTVPSTAPTTSSTSTTVVPTTSSTMATVTTSSTSSTVTPTTSSTSTTLLDCTPLTNCGGVCTDTITVLDCGACGNVCPGYQQPNDNVTCQSGTTCTFTCQGEHYDVDHNQTDGCEVSDPTTGNHTVGNALAVADQSCSDGIVQTITGHLVSDARTHENPAVNGFDSVTGSAPDFYTLTATGGLACIDDISATLTTNGGACYKLIIITNQGTYSASTSAGGTATITQGSGSYSDDTTIIFEVQKTCSTVVTGDVSYTLQFHL
jgi:hypothetical protein